MLVRLLRRSIPFAKQQAFEQKKTEEILKSKIFRVKIGKTPPEKFTDPLNLLTLDNPKDEVLRSVQSAKYLCYSIAEGQFELSKKLYNEESISEVWDYFKLRLADRYGKNATHS